MDKAIGEINFNSLLSTTPRQIGKVGGAKDPKQNVSQKDLHKLTMNTTSSQKNLKIKLKGKNMAATKVKQSMVGATASAHEKLFVDFVFNNPELPERDQKILSEIEEHRKVW